MGTHALGTPALAADALAAGALAAGAQWARSLAAGARGARALAAGALGAAPLGVPPAHVPAPLAAPRDAGARRAAAVPARHALPDMALVASGTGPADVPARLPRRGAPHAAGRRHRPLPRRRRRPGRREPRHVGPGLPPRHQPR